jgi:hypothetical protein
MSKSDTLENDMVKFVMLGTTPSWSAVTEFFLSLHTGDPTDTGSQASFEAAYTGYTRSTLSRSTTALTNSTTGLIDNKVTVSFPVCSAGVSYVTHVGLGISFSGTGTLLYSNPLVSPMAIGAGIAPTFDTSSLTFGEE